LFALTSICTHQGCDVSFVSATSGFHCPCHGARFSFDGKVTLGPANAPLDNYKVCVDSSGNVTVDPNTTVAAGTRTAG
jgi:Rieske Fe-S protein